MANVKISAMNSLSSVVDSTTLPVVDSGTNYKITASQIKTYMGLGNIATVNKDGNASNILYGNGVFAAPAASSSYGNSNVVTLLTSYGSNTITTTGNVSVGNIIGNGQALTGLTGANVTGAVSYATTANSVAVANVSGIGNIATVNKDGNASNILYGNGVFASAPVTYGNTNVASYLSANPPTGTYSNTNVSGYLSSYSSYIANATHATVADSANAVTWSNVSSKPTTISGYGITDSYGNSNVAGYLPTYSGNITGGNIGITGNLTAYNITASNNISYVNTTNQNITDNKITLNYGTSGAPALSASIVIARGTSSNTALRWNESTQVWDQTRDGTSYYTLPINTTELTEGTNLYYTDARANTAFDNRLATKSTTNLTEGTNLYYTDTRANTAFDNRLAAKSTTNLTEGTNLYYTDTRANTAFDNRLATKSTSNVAEGTNLYYTNARANSAMAAFTGNLTAGNASLGNLTTSNYFAGVLTTAAQPNITSVGTLTSLTSGTHTVSANANIAMSGSLSQISGGNLVSASYLTGTLTTAAQPNITSTGTLTSLTVTGNITGGNIVSGGVANITGNITGANLIAGSDGLGNVYAKNIVVNGQPTTYGTVNPAFIVVGLASSVTGLANGQTIILDTVVGNTNSQLSYNSSTGVFTLTAGVTYDMSFTPSFITFSNTTTGFMCYDWVDATTNALLDTTGIGTGTGISSQDTTAQQDNATARIIYKPTTNQTVKLRVSNANGTVTLRGGIGTQAIVRPLNLSIAVQATATGTVNNDYIQAGRITSGQTVSNAATPQDVIFNTSIATNSGIAQNTSTGVFTLTAGKTYELEAQLTYTGMNSTSDYILFNWVDATTNALLDTTGISTGSIVPTTWASNASYGALSKLVYTPNTNQTVKLRITAGLGSGTILSGQGTYAKITQINQAFALNAIDTITTNGNVSVGGNLSLTGSFQGLTPSYTFVDDSASASWYLLGTWNTVQNGQTLYMRIISHSGYNGIANQNQVTELMWSASNGTSTYNGSTGSPMYGAGQASVNSRLGTGGGSYSSPSVFRMVQVSSTQYQVYGYFGSYTRGSTYSVQTSSLCSWVHSGTVVSAPTGNYIAITPSSF